MTEWPAVRARQALAALQRTGWHIARQRGSHRVPLKEGRPDFVFAFHDREEIGRKMLARIVRHAGLRAEDL